MKNISNTTESNKTTMSQVSARAIRRITADIKEYRSNPIPGTAVYQCENPITRVYVAIAGPNDSVYQNGIYFFQFDFTNDYPHEPPKGTFLNWQNTTMRMHPNMYTSGKLCLSILGTWTGPGWTSAMGLNTIILTIQSILDDNPLKNEPGYENNTKSKDHLTYSQIVKYYNYKDFVTKTLKTTLEKPPSEEHYTSYFNEFITTYYKETHQTVTDEIDKMFKSNPDQMKLVVGYQNTECVMNTAKLVQEWAETVKRFIS